MSNLTLNRIDTTFTDAEFNNIKDAIRNIDSSLGGKTRSLTKEERKKLPKINKDNLLFVQDAALAADNARDLLPAYFSSEAMRTDTQYHLQLKELSLLLAQLQEKISDTMMLAGSEAYTSALTVYRMLQAAAKGGVSGAEPLATKLAERFKQASNAPEEDTPAQNG